MKTRKELHDAAKKICCPQAAIDSISVAYSHIENLLCHPYLVSRLETLAILNFHLKHLAFLVTQDESKFNVLAEIQFRIACAIRLYKSIVTEHDLSLFSDNEYEEYLKLIAKTSLEEICK